MSANSWPNIETVMLAKMSNRPVLERVSKFIAARIPLNMHAAERTRHVEMRPGEYGRAGGSWAAVGGEPNQTVGFVGRGMAGGCVALAVSRAPQDVQ